MGKIEVYRNSSNGVYSIKIINYFSTRYIRLRIENHPILNDKIVLKCLLDYIERKDDNATTDNNRQVSWWEKVVLLGLRVQRLVGFK